MKKGLILFLFGCFLTPLSTLAQNAAHNHLQCGTSMETQAAAYRDMVEYRQRYPNVAASRAVSYIPVWFHMVAKSDGTGRTTQANVAEMLCAWNKIYEDNGLEMQFYIKGFSNIDLTALYDGPQSFAGTNRMITTKKTDAMNVYLTGNAGDGAAGGGTVLAYYSNGDGNYSYDWIVCINSEVNAGKASTIAHEAGHMFTLPHTFYGWESTDYRTVCNPCAPATVAYSGRAITVEKVARTGASSNCSTAADGFCDTPEDYNFGYYSSGGCNWSGTTKDPDCVAVNPDETNLMSYFIGCSASFSTEQKNAIRTNFLNHPKRAYLRNASTPLLTSSTPRLLSPANGATTNFFNNIQFDWDDVPGAISYTVEVSRFASFGTGVKIQYVTTSDANFNANNSGGPLLAGVTYYWRVKSVVPYKNCDNTSLVGSFVAGAVNAVNEIAGVSHFNVSPNPLSKSQNLSLEMNSENAFDARVKLYNITGQLMKTENRRFAAGFSVQSVSVSDLTNGTYILTVESEKGVLNKRVVIQ
jgi:hypothetical protein